MESQTDWASAMSFDFLVNGLVHDLAGIASETDKLARPLQDFIASCADGGSFDLTSDSYIRLVSWFNESVHTAYRSARLARDMTIGIRTQIPTAIAQLSTAIPADIAKSPENFEVLLARVLDRCWNILLTAPVQVSASESVDSKQATAMVEALEKLKTGLLGLSEELDAFTYDISLMQSKASIVPDSVWREGEQIIATTQRRPMSVEQVRHAAEAIVKARGWPVYRGKPSMHGLADKIGRCHHSTLAVAIKESPKLRLALTEATGRADERSPDNELSRLTAEQALDDKSRRT